MKERKRKTRVKSRKVSSGQSPLVVRNTMSEGQDGTDISSDISKDIYAQQE